MDVELTRAKDSVKRHKVSVGAYLDNENILILLSLSIDVMGITSLFEDGSNDFDAHKNVYKVWDEIIKRLELPEYKDFLHRDFGVFPINASFISDSIVLSIDATIPDGLYKILLITGLFFSELLNAKPPYFAREAIIVGNIYNENGIVFGPAYIDAYKMEKEARYFKLIIDAKHADELTYLIEDKGKDFITAYLRKDNENNNHYCFDYLHRFFGEFENGVRSNALHNSCIKTLGRVQKKIRDELEKARNQLNTAINEKEINQKRELIHKYKWMEKCFNDTLKKALFNSSKDEYTWLKNDYKNQ